MLLLQMFDAIQMIITMMMKNVHFKHSHIAMENILYTYYLRTFRVTNFFPSYFPDTTSFRHDTVNFVFTKLSR